MAEKKRRKPVDKTKIEYVEPKPSWIKAVKVNDHNDVMGSIIQFFLVESPCKGVSSRGLSLLDYGWVDSVPPKSGYLHRRLLEVANLCDGSTLFTATRKEEMKKRFVDAGMPGNFASTCTSNRVVALINSNFVLDIFRIIRNSLAHCRFQLVDKNGVDFIAFENGMPGKDLIGADAFEVSSRLFLKCSTLIDWIAVVKSEAIYEAEEIARKKETSEREWENKRQLVLSRISNGSYSNKDDLGKDCELSKRSLDKLLGELKAQGLIAYSRSNRKWELTGDANQ